MSRRVFQQLGRLIQPEDLLACRSRLVWRRLMIRLSWGPSAGLTDEVSKCAYPAWRPSALDTPLRQGPVRRGAVKSRGGVGLEWAPFL